MVISVLLFFGQVEWKGVFDVVEIVFLNVLFLVNEFVGVFLQYGIDKDFFVEDCYVVFYDMGVLNMYVVFVYFIVYMVKSLGGGKNLIVQQFYVSCGVINCQDCGMW